MVIPTETPPTTQSFLSTTNEADDLNISQFENPPDGREVIQSVASWLLIYLAGYLTGYLVIIRYIQITRPFLDISIPAMLKSLAVFLSLQFIYLLTNILSKGSHQSWSTKIAQNLHAFNLSPVTSQVLLNLLPMLINTFTVLLSIKILKKLSREFLRTRATKQRDRDRDRNTKAETVKILCMNTGTFIMLLSQVFQATLVPEDKEYKIVLRYVLVNVIPSFLCVLYPIVFVLLTPKIFREFRWFHSGHVLNPHNMVTFKRDSDS